MNMDIEALQTLRNCLDHRIIDLAFKAATEKFYPLGQHRKHYLLSPSGELFVTNNLSRFADEFQLTQSTLSKILCGKLKQHKGWTVIKTEY